MLFEIQSRDPISSSPIMEPRLSHATSTPMDLSDPLQARMASGEPFTHGELIRHGDREADLMQQRWRKRGWIAFKRIGRDTFWSLTQAGKEEVARVRG
jgi:hypothetical protein